MSKRRKVNTIELNLRKINKNRYVTDKYNISVGKYRQGKDKVIDAISWGKILWIRVQRKDNKPIHSWKDLQEIKNRIAGEEKFAIEVYPRKSRTIDYSNAYHLFVLPKKFKMPITLTANKYA